ncbi:ParB/Srx family N-terminal domain-containing protein [Alcaligenes parafaecalis]|uniref:ParB/Srx family N-terminal domain-containing protein n=1 Tax=Alcaligenes parafaecalis TaxID=171260 RepID=A0ABT3VIU0_9BURK|nr:ParB/Srx family N-terminal domain-containing protein [Alcaligenes parafaecalis]MCX5463183.1 ParB/Srx family N-terminal domain-containing protein [Alcaligenes parafaecalis]
MTLASLHTLVHARQQLLRALGIALLPLALAACDSGSSTGGNNSPEAPVVTPPVTEEPTPEPPRNTAYLNSKAGDVIKVHIDELHPTQAAIGYDQVYYKLGRWQGDLDRSTWANNPKQQLDYLNRTIGKKFDDYCEDMGGTERAQKFLTIAEVQAARLDQPTTYLCKDPLGSQTENLKTVVVGWDGNLYLTDGHHTFSSLREISDGGPKLPVWVKVSANYSDIREASAFWERMSKEKLVWLRDGQNQAITVEQLPTRVGLASEKEAGGMQEDRYRSLVYFTRDIAYNNGNLPEYAEFLWGDWLRRQASGGQLAKLDEYLMAPPATPAQILAASTLNKALKPGGSDDSYTAAVRDAALKMTALNDTDLVFEDRDAAALGRIALEADAASESVTKTARDTLEELPRDDVKSDGSPRGAGKLWFAVNYRNCGKPAAGTCWGW